MDPFDFDAGLLFWAIVTFALLFLLLSRFAFKPLGDLLARREQTLHDSLESAERARQAAEALLGQNDERLAAAREEARKVVNEGHRIVADMKREAQSHSKEEADAIVKQARTEIDFELQRSLDELKSTVANLSVRISRQVLKEDLNEERHEALADEFIERLKKSHARKPNR